MEEFKTVINGYAYRILGDVECDGKLCSAEIEVERFGYKTYNINEVDRYIGEFVDDIMKYHFKEKYKGYSPDGRIRTIGDNIYSLNWIIDMKHGRYSNLKKFCEGHEIEILSGNFAGRRGVFLVKQEGKSPKRVIEYVNIDGKEINLKGVKFWFTDGYTQIAYEEIKE